MSEDVLIGVICCIIFIAITAGWKFFDNLKEIYSMQNMFRKVGWIAEKERTMCYSDSINLRNMELISYIAEEQSKMNIPKQHHIDFSNDREIKNVEEILNFHKNKVVESYFHGILSKSRNICKLTPLEYYFFSLYCFLYKEVDNGNSSFKWRLTDDGIAFFKLYLITNIFIESNENTRKLFEYINPNLKNLTMEHLEKINSHLKERTNNLRKYKQKEIIHNEYGII